MYIATDEDCVNIVYRGAIVGSPAYAPRTTGPLELPTDTDRLALARGDTLDARRRRRDLDGRRHRFGDERGRVSCSTAATPGAAPAAPAATTAAKVDLPDTAWPTGRYYWTVVPVIVEPKPTPNGPSFPATPFSSGIARPSCRRTPASPAA